jgi:hypothetical protein
MAKKRKSPLLEIEDQKLVIRKVKPFSDRGAYFYLLFSWLGKKVKIRPINWSVLDISGN